MDKIFRRVIESILFKKVKEAIKDIFKERKSTEPKSQIPGKNPSEKTHPWRVCAIGEHWKRDHPLKVPISEKNPEGYTIRDGHCHGNPTKRKGRSIQDYLHPDEIHLITQIYAAKAFPRPAQGKLKEFPKADHYDDAIAVWVQYWNEVFKPEEYLDPNLLKALIASESSFEPIPKEQYAGRAGQARGLIQITDQAIQVMNDLKSDLKNHHIQITKENVSDPIISIAAGTRWLFEKRRLAAHRLKRNPTWEESVAEYKAYLKDMLSGKTTNPKGMIHLRDFYKKLKD